MPQSGALTHVQLNPRTGRFRRCRDSERKEFASVQERSPRFSVSLNYRRYRDWPGSITWCLPARRKRARIVATHLLWVNAHSAGDRLRTLGLMSAQCEELLRLVEALPEDEIPAVLDDVRRHLRAVRSRPWPPAWFGTGKGRTMTWQCDLRICSETDSAVRRDCLRCAAAVGRLGPDWPLPRSRRGHPRVGEVLQQLAERQAPPTSTGPPEVSA